MSNLAICDDDAIFISKFEKSLRTFRENRETSLTVTSFDNGYELFEHFAGQDLDVVFLDIDMPDLSGFEMAERIKREWPECIIIFCSNHNELVYDSFEYEPFWFLCKERYDEKLDDILQKLLAKLQPKKEVFVIWTKEDIVTMNYQDIWYLTVFRHNVQIHKKDKVVEYRESLANIENQFFCQDFVKINSGCLVNMDAIRRIDDDQVILKNNETLFISRSRKKEVKEQFFTFLERD